MQVTSRIISPDQAGYLQGRCTGDNIRMMLDMLDITKYKIDLGMIDFEIAFDTI